MTTAIGKIVKSNTHIDYVCQIYNPGEVERWPQSSDYSFGTFVSIRMEEGVTPGVQLIGVIYNTLLMNPDFGNLGPRLSPRQDLEIFTPDYLSETATLVGIIALGWVDGDTHCHHGVPALAATVNCPVIRLETEELCSFHTNQMNRLNMSYASVLLGLNSPLVPQLLMTIVDRLSPLFPDQAAQLAVMRNNLAWKSIVQPSG